MDGDPLTFDEVTAAGKVASCQLPGGALLRYDPRQGRVSILPYPATPSAWKGAAAYLGDLPEDGWSHYPGCACEVCAAAASGVLAAVGPQEKGRSERRHV